MFFIKNKTPVKSILKKSLYESLWEGNKFFPIEELARALGFGVYVSDLDLGEVGYIDIGSEKWEIVVNRKENAFRQRFTIAHLLAHYYLGHLKSEVKRRQDYSQIHFYSFYQEEEETKANNLACQLLMPKRKFIKKFNEYGGNIERIAFFFRVSSAATLFYINYLNLYINPFTD